MTKVVLHIPLECDKVAAVPLPVENVPEGLLLKERLHAGNRILGLSVNCHATMSCISQLTFTLDGFTSADHTQLFLDPEGHFEID